MAGHHDETIEQRLADQNDDRKLRVLNVSSVSDSNEIGSYLLEEFCRKEEKNVYWPTTHGNEMRFLAQSRDTNLNKQDVCLTGIRPEHAAKWIASISEYMENCDPTRNTAFSANDRGSTGGGNQAADRVPVYRLCHGL